MTNKDYIKIKFDFIKMLVNLIIGFAITLALYNMQNLKNDIITWIISLVLIVLIIFALCLGKEIRKLFEELKLEPWISTESKIECKYKERYLKNNDESASKKKGLIMIITFIFFFISNILAKYLKVAVLFAK